MFVAVASVNVPVAVVEVEPRAAAGVRRARLPAPQSAMHEIEIAVAIDVAEFGVADARRLLRQLRARVGPCRASRMKSFSWVW